MAALDSEQICLKSPNLCLKSPAPEMAEAILAYQQRNREFLTPWSPKVRQAFYTLAYQQSKILQEMELLQTRRLLRLWISNPQQAPGQILGHVSFSNIVWGAFRSCFLGYSIDQAQLGRGYATEAVATGVCYVFEQLRLHRIEANIMPRNQASIRVAEKLDFVCEGLSPKYLKINGVWEDHLHYVLRNLALE